MVTQPGVEITELHVGAGIFADAGMRRVAAPTRRRGHAHRLLTLRRQSSSADATCRMLVVARRAHFDVASRPCTERRQVRIRWTYQSTNCSTPSPAGEYGPSS
jgi:hypothetical protein